MLKLISLKYSQYNANAANWYVNAANKIRGICIYSRIRIIL